MSKTTSSKIDTDHIAMIAACLADNYLKPLNDFCNEKKYFGYIGSLAEISNWAHEFYNGYCHKLNEWDAFEGSEDNIYNAVNWDDFLVAWGYSRLQQFFVESTNMPKSFPGKISKTVNRERFFT